MAAHKTDLEPTAAAGQRRFVAGVETIFLLALPICGFFALHFKPRIQMGLVDPYFYTGYINNFLDLFHRFGRTYFGLRFGLILPARFFTWIFGPEVGFYVLRYLLALTFGVPLYFAIKRHLNAASAVVVYSSSIASPYFARALLWDHPDAAGVPFLSAAVCLFLLEPQRRWKLWFFAVGCIAAMAIHSNLFTAAIFGIFIVAYALVWVQRHLDIRVLFARLLWVTAGMAAVTVAGTIYYWIVIGSWNIFGPTVFIAISLSRGRMGVWRYPGFSWTLTLFHVFVPIWLAGCCAIAWARRPRTPPISIALYFAFGVSAFYYVHQFLLYADTLQLFYYFSYAIPAVFLMVALITFRLWEQARVPAPAFVALSIAATSVPWIFLSFGIRVFGAAPLRRFLWTAAMVLVVICAARWSRPGRAARILAVAGVILLGLGFDLGFSTYSYTIQPRSQTDTSELDVYRVGLQLIRAVPPMKDPLGKTLFWYNGSNKSPITWVQSTFLWDYSKLNQGLTVLGADQIKRLQSKDVRYLGLLGGSPVELQSGLAALTHAGIAYRERDRRKLASGGLKLWWLLVQLR